MPSLANHHLHRRGFTLIEILVSIAIMGILTAIIFSGLRTEQQRSASKEAADRLQIELVGLQNRIQSAVVTALPYCTRNGGNYSLQGNYCEDDTSCLIGGVQGRCITGPPAAYGLEIITGQSTYTMFADMPMGLTAANGKRGDFNDQGVVTNKTLGTNIRVVTMQANNAGTADQLDISFGGSNGQMRIVKTGGSSLCTTSCASARIVLQNTKTQVCYAITVDAATSIVSRRQLAPTCT